jgi:hypothetical protein
MSSKKVSELTETTSFSDGIYVPVVNGSTTYKMSLENLLKKTFRSDKTELETFSDELFVPLINGSTTYLMSLENLLQKTLRVDKASEIDSVASKSSISDTDLMLMEDSASENEKKKCTKAQFLHDVPQVITGSGAPGDAPAKKGMIYIDTAVSDVYIAADTTVSGDWKKIT